MTATTHRLSDRDRLALLRAEYAGLLASARAAVAADRAGQHDALAYVRDALMVRGLLPPVGARPSALLAAALPQERDGGRS